MTQNLDQQNAACPTEIRLTSSKNSLAIAFDDGCTATLSAELLRVESPSAEVQGHGAGQKITPTGKQDVVIVSIEPVGNYAIRIGFNDGHNTGIYSWGLLRDYANRQDDLMSAYLKRLAEIGGSRA